MFFLHLHKVSIDIDVTIEQIFKGLKMVAIMCYRLSVLLPVSQCSPTPVEI